MHFAERFTAFADRAAALAAVEKNKSDAVIDLGMHCLQTIQLSHRFGKETPILRGIDLEVPAGSIYGFLGPNGAGKTTTLKLILGLLSLQQGMVNIFGKDFTTNRLSILRETGAFIENPSVYGQLSAAENMELFRLLYRTPKEWVSEALEITGLAHTGKKPAGKFSLGMKQRLGIAIALLHRPKLLILDEPTNGLDPNGILEIRELLKRLNREKGITILLSSHLLSEIEKTATHTGIIHQGRMLYQGSLENLLTKDPQRNLENIFMTFINTPQI